MTDEKSSRKSSSSYNEKVDIEVISHERPTKFVRSPEEERVFKKINKAFVPYMCILLFFQV